jgi:hypothetical protein
MTPERKKRFWFTAMGLLETEWICKEQYYWSYSLDEFIEIYRHDAQWAAWVYLRP